MSIAAPHHLHRDQRQHIERLARLDTNAQVAAQDVNPTIQRSWLRCLNEYKLDPTQPRPARVVPHHTIIEHRDAVDELLHVARAGVEQLYSQIARLNYVLLLADCRGITVEFRGNPGQDAALRRAGLYLGADWNERFAGTCAVGTCLHDGKAIVCHRQEHFDASHIALTCTAAPICDPHGNMMAVLDISALNSPKASESQNFGLSLVTLYARMIEDAYFLQRYRDTLVIRFDTAREFVHVNGRGLIALEESGRIIAANSVGRRLISAHQQRWPSWSNTLQLSLDALFDGEIADILAINRAHFDKLCAFRARANDTTYFVSLLEPKRAPREAAKGSAASLPAPLARLGADDPAIRNVQRLALRLCDETTVNVLISGETGTGKEVVARALHDSSQRRHAPFVAVNCAAIPEALIESELFGYAPGAFTGGHPKGMRGLIAKADGGTLFLDEIGDMPLALQTRLLRVIAEREVVPLGAQAPCKVDIRIITATHRHIDALVAQGAFREDLYYRLNGAQLSLPALRERADQHQLIRRVFDDLVAERADDRPAPLLRADAMSALLAYSWPGNIRELKNALAFALMIADGNEITVNDLPERCLSQRITKPRLEPDEVSTESHALAVLLHQQRWNVSAVARLLGVSRPTIYRQMKRQNIVPPHRQS